MFNEINTDITLCNKMFGKVISSVNNESVLLGLGDTLIPHTG